MRFLGSVLTCGLALLVVGLACGGRGPAEVVLFSEEPAPAAYELGSEEIEAQPVALTVVAGENRRLREAHMALIESIPVTVEPTPTLTLTEREEVAVARVVAHPLGVPVKPSVTESWFDSRRGLTFYRDSGGDWTGRSVRESHTHRYLFYHKEYPEGVLSFGDRSIFPALSRELAFEASVVLPLLGEVTPAMVTSFGRKLGWELRDSAEPAVNLSTTFVVRKGGVRSEYAVGGVMVMSVLSKRAGEEYFEYLAPGRWVGPVVVERLE